MRLTAIEYVLIILVVFIFLRVGFHNDNSPNVPKSGITSDNSETEIFPELKKEISVEEFRSAYNAVAQERNVPDLRINEFEFGTGNDRDKFGYKFAQGFFLLGEIDDETGYIKILSVTKAFVLSGSKRKMEAQVAALVFLMVVQVLTPELSPNERADIINQFADSKKPYVEFSTDKITYSQTLLEDGKVLMLSAVVN